jgi:hypothetical protein
LQVWNVSVVRVKSTRKEIFLQKKT